MKVVPSIWENGKIKGKMMYRPLSHEPGALRRRLNDMGTIFLKLPQPSFAVHSFWEGGEMSVKALVKEVYST